ncbi:Kelch-like protein 33 [Geodia barretti]|uniref:Kelch-like protein 33 n=1 Tax=Geodia barretti TaxID=519541 RepID=A0AA35T634_GEOBA|nr:Kelch-like protein 33 [Geodia barretti]
MVYCADGFSCEVLMFNSRTWQWTILPECPKRFFSIAVVNGQLTAIGRKQSYKATNTLFSLPQDRPGIFQQKWIEQFPPMTYCRSSPAVATTNTSLIVAGGWGLDMQKASVEVMDIQTLQWSTVASLPLPFNQATATICGDRLYIGGGFSTDGSTKSVVMCEVKDLLQSQPQSLATRPGLSSSPPVWKEVAPLPVFVSSLVTFQGQLLAVGGSTTGRDADSTSDVMQYDVTTNSWKVVSQMKVKRRRCFAAVLPNNTLMVCGGHTPDRT